MDTLTLFMKNILLVALVTGVLLIRIGMALYASGCARSKNAAGALLRSTIDWTISILAFWLIGIAILFQQHNAYFGFRPRLIALIGENPSPDVLMFFAMAILTSGFFVTAIGERSRLSLVIVGSILLSGIIMPIAGHWSWVGLGFLRHKGFFDSGGGAVIHFTCGITSAVAALLLGPRAGKYNRDGSANAIPGHSVPLELGGVLLIFAGWIPYLAGASLLNQAEQPQSFQWAALNALIAGAAVAIVSMVYGRIRYGKIEVFLTCSGLLGALVAVAPAGGYAATHVAFIIGAVAGFLVPVATVLLDVKFKIDDPGGTIAIQTVGGAWGIIAIGLFLLRRFPRAIFTQILGLIVCGALAVAVSFLVFTVLKTTLGIRSKEADEYDGLDLAEHDINAYPDFQQTMIKSYHLREA